MHGHSMVSVYKCIDMSLLPSEYLPDDYEEECAGTMEEITGILSGKHVLRYFLKLISSLLKLHVDVMKIVNGRDIERQSMCVWNVFGNDLTLNYSILKFNVIQVGKLTGFVYLPESKNS